MIMISGIWIAILPYMKWNQYGKRLSNFHLAVGLYTCVSSVLFMVNNRIFHYIWVQIAYIMMCILLIMDIAAKLKLKKSALDVLSILTSVIGLILSVFVCFMDLEEISSSVMMIVGSMMIGSIPFKMLNKASGASEDGRVL